MNTEKSVLLTNEAEIQRQIHECLKEVDKEKKRITVVFVTNIRNTKLVDIDENGIVNAAQHYTLRKASSIISNFEKAGFHTVSYFSEGAFFDEVLNGELRGKCREIPIVFSSAEGGSGPGRRALIPAFCNLNSIAYCNSSAHGCSVARHKHHANAVLSAAGLRVPESWMYSTKYGWVAGKSPKTGSKVIIKPMYESMAIGIDDQSVTTVLTDFEELIEVRSKLIKQPIAVQEFFSGFEIGIPIIDLKSTAALPIVLFSKGKEKRFGKEARTFKMENLTTDVELESFSQYPKEQLIAIQESAICAFNALDMSGMGRIDMRVDEDGRAWIFDTNESPPPIPNTSYAYSLHLLGFGVEDMLSLWISTGLNRAKQ